MLFLYWCITLDVYKGNIFLLVHIMQGSQNLIDQQSDWTGQISWQIGFIFRLVFHPPASGGWLARGPGATLGRDDKVKWPMKKSAKPSSYWSKFNQSEASK